MQKNVLLCSNLINTNTMKISLNWLSQYINIDTPIEKLSTILTDIGLEVESVEKIESIQGGLRGVVVGKVCTCEKHPNADKLHVTTVDIGNNTILPIVCGAPNIAAGQTVLVATEGTILYAGNQEFVIKKTKIRGEVSCGMICAEDELGLGVSHEGIMVLPDSVTAGTLAKEYFEVEEDYIFEIGLTPNRIDAASHIGVARDLAAFFSIHSPKQIHIPDISKFSGASTKHTISVTVEDPDMCPRYTGLVIENVQVQESPNWLKHKLTAIGQKPINNIVDITNYVLHECGQPLHAFDLEKITGNAVRVKTCSENTHFVTLDGLKRTLRTDDLMICNSEAPMCIAGILGGLESGVSNTTKHIFLESAYFSPTHTRKTAKHHGLSTDASFRFERGIDPNNTLYALKRAALLMQEIAGGTISDAMYDSNPNPVAPFEIEISLTKITQLIGKDIPKQTIITILNNLDINVQKDTGDSLVVHVPAYRVDVQRQEDIVEEILRIYGYNSIEIPDSIHYSISYSKENQDDSKKNKTAELFTSLGWFETMNNSLTKSSYYAMIPAIDDKNLVHILNPLSSELNVMRAHMLFSALEVVVYNNNRQLSDIRIFEFGKTYTKTNKKGSVTEAYHEQQMLSLCVSGNYIPQNWTGEAQEADYFYLKSCLSLLFQKLGMQNLSYSAYNDDVMQGQKCMIGTHTIAEFGLVSPKIIQSFDISKPVFYAHIYWDTLLAVTEENRVLFQAICQFPEVKRDLSLLLDKHIEYAQIEEIAKTTETKRLQSVSIFDIYEGKGVPEGKKSYAVSFILQDSNKTLTDKEIDGIMQKLISAYSQKLGAELR